MKAHLLNLVEYERWANQHILDLMESATELPSQAARLFSHILSAQQVWLARFTGELQQPAAWGTFPLKEWPKIMHSNLDKMRSYIESKSEPELQQQLSYTNSTGLRLQTKIADIFTHLSLHSSYHRGQLVAVMKPYSERLPATDFIFYTRRSDYAG